MTTMIAGTAYRKLLYGIKVDKAAATLPATAYGSLFTVAGGRVIITSIVGEVTTICSATATNLKLTATPTTGTAVDVATNVAIANKEAGTLFGVSAYGSALVASNAGSTPVAQTPFDGFPYSPQGWTPLRSTSVVPEDPLTPAFSPTRSPATSNTMLNGNGVDRAGERA